MTVLDQKAILKIYLQEGREAILWKLKDLSEYDLRRPLVPTGTNLLGLVKHLAAMDGEYFGLVFGRPFPGGFPSLADDAPPNADMWATAEESSAYLVDSSLMAVPVCAPTARTYRIATRAGGLNTAAPWRPQHCGLRGDHCTTVLQ